MPETTAQVFRLPVPANLPPFTVSSNLPPGARLDLTSLFCDVFAVELAERFSPTGKENDHAVR